MLFPKQSKPKKRRKHSKSILQPKEDKRCYLCMLSGFYGVQQVEEHHIFDGPNRRTSEELGLKCNLCLRHHRIGPEAVHNNAENMHMLQQEAQRAFEETHTREEFISRIGRNYL